MTTAEIIAVFAIAVPNSIALLKWYSDAKKARIAASSQAEQKSSPAKDKKLLGPADIFVFGTPLLCSVVLFVWAVCVQRPVDLFSVGILVAAVGMFVLDLMLLAITITYKSITVIHLMSYQSTLQQLLDLQTAISKLDGATTHAMPDQVQQSEAGNP